MGGTHLDKDNQSDRYNVMKAIEEIVYVAKY